MILFIRVYSRMPFVAGICAVMVGDAVRFFDRWLKWETRNKKQFMLSHSSFIATHICVMCILSQANGIMNGEWWVGPDIKPHETYTKHHTTQMNSKMKMENEHYFLRCPSPYSITITIIIIFPYHFFYSMRYDDEFS